jgi:hypothetical protein
MFVFEVAVLHVNSAKEPGECMLIYALHLLLEQLNDNRRRSTAN